MNTRNRPAILLLVAGVGITAIAQYITHFTATSDTSAGVINGLGIGLLLVALWMSRRPLST